MGGQKSLRESNNNDPIRDSDDYEKKWEYVRNNPVRHGHVSNPDDWPFQGEIFYLPWD